jgi:glutaredoxin-like protein NrdH
LEFTKIKGRNKEHRILIYALSTCVWCNRTKKLLQDNGIEYEYVDVDLSDKDDQMKIRSDIVRRGGKAIYPTLIIDDKILITGFQEDRIKEALHI